MGRDNSEDAVTWNVFRYLEKNNQLTLFLKDLFNVTDDTPDIIYWSYSQQQQGVWSWLQKAREEFELIPAKGSEPDIIISGTSTLIFIEAKLTASNNTVPSKMRVKDKYITGGQRWWEQVIRTDFDTIANKQRKYELARLWLLGTWIAKQSGRNFILANLVLDRLEKDIQTVFTPYINTTPAMRFDRITWEQIYQKVIAPSPATVDKNTMCTYFQNKTIGYKNGVLTKVFAIQVP